MIKVPFLVGGPRSLDNIPPHLLDADRPAIITAVPGSLDYHNLDGPVEYAVYLRHSGWVRRPDFGRDDRFVAWIFEDMPMDRALDLIVSQMDNPDDLPVFGRITPPRLDWPEDQHRIIVPVVIDDGPRRDPARVIPEPGDVEYAGETISEDHWSYNPGGLIGHAMSQYDEINHYLASTQPPGPEPGKDAARWTPDLLKEDDHDGNV